MNRQRLLIFSLLTLVFVGVSFLYFLRVWQDSTTRFRTGLPVPRSILPEELLRADEIIPQGPPTLPTIRPDDPLLAGNEKSPVTMVLFGDFQCQYCRDQALAMEDALRIADPGNAVRVVWRDVPLTNQHPQAMAAATVAQCAARQGKFRQMHDALFFKAKDFSDSEFLNFATEIGLESNTFLTCLRDPAIRTRLNQDLDDARSHAILQVPLLFVNGQPIEGYVDTQTLVAIIQKQLETVKP